MTPINDSPSQLAIKTCYLVERSTVVQDTAVQLTEEGSSYE